MKETPEIFFAENRQAWRDWLSLKHDRSNGIALVIYKKASGRTNLSYAEAVEEALCFGWIDSRANKLDDGRYLLRFVPRKPGSTWAASNKERVSRLIAQGLMTEAGLKVIERAKQDGSWDSINDIENLKLPPEVEKALKSEPAALDRLTG
jgi:uncharacterized protein YdeI (YjbR/CyaY-like superfamily)